MEDQTEAFFVEFISLSVPCVCAGQTTSRFSRTCDVWCYPKDQDRHIWSVNYPPERARLGRSSYGCVDPTDHSSFGDRHLCRGGDVLSPASSDGDHQRCPKCCVGVQCPTKPQEGQPGQKAPSAKRKAQALSDSPALTRPGPDPCQGLGPARVRRAREDRNGTPIGRPDLPSGATPGRALAAAAVVSATYAISCSARGAELSRTVRTVAGPPAAPRRCSSSRPRAVRSRPGGGTAGTRRLVTSVSAFGNRAPSARQGSASYAFCLT
jgi:hypothetical protein